MSARAPVQAAGSPTPSAYRRAAACRKPSARCGIAASACPWSRKTAHRRISSPCTATSLSPAPSRTSASRCRCTPDASTRAARGVRRRRRSAAGTSRPPCSVVAPRACSKASPASSSSSITSSSSVRQSRCRDSPRGTGSAARTRSVRVIAASTSPVSMRPRACAARNSSRSRYGRAPISPAPSCTA
jgi:hypothetical protein